jgi:hypothetical protein
LNLVEITANNANIVKGPARNAATVWGHWKYCSLNLPDQWICYNFMDATITPTGYAVSAVSSFRGRPRQWVIEGWNGRDNWIELDNQMDVSREEAIVEFQISKPISVPVIRIRQTGPNWEENDVFQFSGFELFGTLVSNQIQGIIAHLIKDSPRSIDHHALQIPLSSSQDSDSIRNLPCADSRTAFSSQDIPNQWILYDFRFRTIDLIGYQVTMPNDCNAGRLRQWVLEGFVDMEHWTLVDERRDVEALNHPGASVSFATFPERKVRCIRLRQTGTNWSGNYQLTVAWIDFSGYITYQKPVS